MSADGFWDNIAISCIAFNPANTQEIYVGTGEGWFNADAALGGGIWKSSNGGTTWALLGSTEPGGYVSTSNFHYVNKIAIKSNGTIFAATRACAARAACCLKRPTEELPGRVW